jgi:hypothetical protein
VIHDPLNESLAERPEHDDEQEMRVSIDIPDGFKLVLIINGVIFDLGDYD